jgi:hypothetical protein
MEEKKAEKKEKVKEGFEPTLLYRCPGSHPAGPGQTYDSRPASSQEELDQLLKDGWSATLPEAIVLAKKGAPDAPGSPPPKVK